MVFDDFYTLIDENNLTLNENDFSSMLNENMKMLNLSTFDPEIGTVLNVISLEVDGDYKKLYAIVEGNNKIELNYSEEKTWIQEYLFKYLNFKILNKKETFYIINNHIQEDLINAFASLNTQLVITENSFGKIIGSISQIHRNNIYLNFHKCLHEDSLEVFECKIIARNFGGFYGLIDSTVVFVPGSLAYHKRIEDYDKFIGTTLLVCIENYSKEKDVFVFSHVKYLKHNVSSILQDFDKNVQIECTVSSIASFGIFLSFADMLTGLLHISEMTEETLKRFNNNDIKINDTLLIYFKQIVNDKVVFSERNYNSLVEEWYNEVEVYRNKFLKLELIKIVSSGYLFIMPNGKLKAMLFESEASRCNTNYEVGKTYDVKIERTEFETNKIYLSCL